MVTVHRALVADSAEEIAELKAEWEDYIEQARSYAFELERYEEAVKEDIEDGSRDVELHIDRLVDEYDELMLEQEWLDREIGDSSLRGHASYPRLEPDAVQEFKREYGRAPGEMMEEDPTDFYYAVATDFIEREGVEWVVESLEVNDLEDLAEAAATCQAAEVIKLPWENEALPDTVPEGSTLRPGIFDPLLEAHQEAGQETTYETVSDYERHVFDEYDRSVLNEVWGMEMNPEVLDQIEGSQEFTTASD